MNIEIKFEIYIFGFKWIKLLLKVKVGWEYHGWEYLSGTNGKICDPYVLLRETDERIEEMRSLRTYKPINLLRGRCFIKLKDGTELQGTWRQGRREGPGMATTPDLEKLGVLAVSGNYRDGVLQGLGRVHMLDESIWDGWFLNGKLHGPVRGYCKVRDSLSTISKRSRVQRWRVWVVWDKKQ